MARSSAVEVTNSFIKGLITEATGLNFPENACVDTDNCKFDFKGVVTRRAGIDYEASYSSFSATRSSSAIATYVWTAVGGNGDITLVVVQIGATLYFYLEDDDGPLSPGKQSFTVDLTALDTTGNPGVNLLVSSVRARAISSLLILTVIRFMSNMSRLLRR
jgi:hypothetical protein